MTPKFFKQNIIHLLDIAVKASCTDRDEKIFFRTIIKDISALDPNTVNIPQTVIKYLGYAKESPAITVLKKDLQIYNIYLLDKSHF